MIGDAGGGPMTGASCGADQARRVKSSTVTDAT
jgi:hypothetical protein